MERLGKVRGGARRTGGSGSADGLAVSGCTVFFFSSRRRHTRLQGDWSSDVCSSDLAVQLGQVVDVGGLAGHMQMGRLMRATDAHALALGVGTGLGALVHAEGGVLQVMRKGLGRVQQGGIDGAVHFRLLGALRGASRSRRWWPAAAAAAANVSPATGAAAGSAPP